MQTLPCCIKSNTTIYYIWLALWAGKIIQILCYDLLPEQDRAILPTRDYSYLSRKEFIPNPYNKSFIDQVWPVGVAGYQLHIFCKFVDFDLASSRRSVSQGAVQKTACEKIKKARREEVRERLWAKLIKGLSAHLQTAYREP